MLRAPPSPGEVATRMQPSGQAWAQVEQPVQRSSNQTRLVRARAGMGRTSSGYCTVKGGRAMCLSVTNIPFRMPAPYMDAPSAAGGLVPSAQHSHGGGYGEAFHKVRLILAGEGVE